VFLLFGVGWLIWVDDVHFNVCYYLCHIGLLVFGGVEELCMLVGCLFV